MRAPLALRNRYVRVERGLEGQGVWGAGPRHDGAKSPAIDPRLQSEAATMADKNKVADQYYAPPPDLGKWESLRIFLWNSETGQFMGRTGGSWGKCVSFSTQRFLEGKSIGFFLLERIWDVPINFRVYGIAGSKLVQRTRLRNVLCDKI